MGAIDVVAKTSYYLTVVTPRYIPLEKFLTGQELLDNAKPLIETSSH